MADRVSAESILATLRESLLVLNAELRVIVANDAFYRTFRTHPEATLDRFIYDLGDGQWDIPSLRDLLAHVLPLQTEVRDYLVEHDFPGLGPRIFVLNAREIREPGGDDRLLLLAIEDITEREDERRALATLRSELEASNRELEAFAYSVSHDLRAPLRSMSGFGQRLLDLYDDQLDDRGRDYLRRIRNASERMAELVNGILQISRLGRTQVTRAPVDLTSMARRILGELRREDPTREATTEIAEGVTVQGDLRLLEQLLRNLLENAWKFTSKRPVAQIEFGTSEREGKTVYFVRDNGAGFDMQYAGELFGLFQRLHSRREYEGTGIGLAIAKRIVQRHDGEIWAEAEAERGATFCFTLD